MRQAPTTNTAAAPPLLKPGKQHTHGRRRTLHLGSLRAQLALGSAFVALSAIVIVALLSLIGVNLTVLSSQRTVIATTASRLAHDLGQGKTDFTVPTTGAPTQGSIGNLPGSTLAPSPGILYTVWVMDTHGHINQQQAPDTTTSAQEDAQLGAALRAALHGQEQVDFLPNTSSWLEAIVAPQTVRWYAALPIQAEGLASGKIIGAVALASSQFRSPQVLSRRLASPSYSLISTPGFGNWMILGAALLAALLAGGVAVVFSRRLTRPLEHLVTATRRLRAGEYATRVRLRAPSEVQELIATFNEMAAALEAHLSTIHHQESQRRELLANVAHDLATPLTMIQGYTEALAEGMVHDPARRTRTTQVIGREAARLRRMVDQLRQITLLEAGIPGPQWRAVDLGALVEATLTALAPALSKKQLTTFAAGLGDLPPVRADSDWVTEIVVNVVENAVRHTPAGGHITITGNHDGEQSCLHIADTGPGIPPQDRERIFERFTRLDTARNSSAGGSGLGLAIVKALVEAQGGTIMVEDSPVGEGTCFAITFPVYQG